MASSSNNGSDGFSPPRYNTNGEESPPRNRSTSFSISDILSEDVGRVRQRRRTSSGDSVFSNTSSSPHDSGDERIVGGVAAGGRGSISLSDAATMMTSPQIYFTTAISNSAHPIQTTPIHSTRANNANITLSPFNPTLLQMLGQQSTPTNNEKEDFFNDSLGMLSTVALYHNELSNNTHNGSAVQEKMAAMKLAYTSDVSVGSQESVEGSVANKSTTPCILKHGKKRQRASSGSSTHSSSSVSVSKSALDQSSAFNTGFLSPLANEKSQPTAAAASKLNFSPSIFLSRPSTTERSTSSSQMSALSVVSSSSAEQSSFIAPVTTGSPVSSSDTTHHQHHHHPPSDNTGFITSTPIKTDKENAGSGGKRLFIRDEMSSDSDAELHVPSKKVKRLTCRKSKARTKLSPLLENACSPIAKTDPIQPSPLALTSFQPSPTSVLGSRTTPPNACTMDVSTHASTTQAIPVISIQDHDRSSNNTSATQYPLHFQQQQQQHALLQHNMQQLPPQQQHQQQAFIPTQGGGFYPHPFMLPGTPLPPAFGYLPTPQPRYYLPSYYPPQPVIHPTPGMVPQSGISIPAWNLAVGMHHAQYWGGNNGPAPVISSSLSLSASSVVQSDKASSGGGGNSQMQSVPPWFIFNQSKSEGKRSRLTEAINRSLTETPSQNPKLPAEWTKLACGQTADQKMLTAKARSFLQCQPRQLTFDDVK